MKTATASKRKEEADRIESESDADLALEKLGRLTDRIGEVESREREVIRLAQERMKLETAEDRAAVEALENALEEWAEKESKRWLPKKSLELLFGTVGFRVSPATIKLLDTVEKVIARLKANKMRNCVRVKEQIEMRALWAYDDKVLKKVGCEKADGEERFFYELKPRAQT